MSSASTWRTSASWCGRRSCSTRETHKSRGFCYVVFEDEASVDHVLQRRQHSIDGKMVSPLDPLTAVWSRAAGPDACVTLVCAQMEVKRAIPRNQVASPIESRWGRGDCAGCEWSQARGTRWWARGWG
jgi:hypothetical protein